MNFSGFNIWELLLAAASSFMIGAAWYSPSLFGNSWQKLVGLSDETIKEANMPLIFGLAFILMLIIASFISLFVEIAMMMGSTAIYGAMAGAFLCLVLVIPAFGVNYLFARRPLPLFLIDAGYMLVSFIVMGFIIGFWR